MHVHALYINLKFGDKSKSADSDKEDFGERFGASKISKQYVYLVFSFAALSIMVFYAADYVFYEQLESMYKDESEAAGFLGIFAAVMGILNLLSNTLATGKLMTRYGQGFGLLSVPVAVIACCVLAIFVKSSVVTFFWVIVLLKLMDEVVRNTLGEPALRILYQPFPAGERMQVQTRLEGVLEPAAGALTGVILLAVSGFELESVHLVYVMFGVLAIWIGNSLWLRQEYTKVWASAVTRRKRSIDGTALFREDGSRESVIEGLNSPEPGKVIYCLNVLEEVEHEQFDKFMAEMLSHDHPDVRIHVLDKIRRRAMTGLTRQVIQVLDIEENSKVIGAALQTLCKLAETEAYEQVYPYLENDDADIRKGALIGLLRDSGIEGVMVAGAKINSLLDSRYPAERKLAAFVLGEVGHSSFYRPLLQLLQDQDMEVRSSAITASGKLRNTKLISLLLENLAITQVRSAVVPAIIAFGEAILPALEDAFDEEEKYRNVRSRIIRIIGRIGGDQAVAILKKKVDSVDETVRNLILNSLVMCKYQASDAERPQVREKIRHEVKDAAWTLSVSLDIGDYKNAEKLTEALRNEFRKIVRKSGCCWQ
ncbi:MAG: MFS transporter [Desulfobacteraceae bacterium]|nr:MFS transporter [Desulfobacteraceae bacterium]